MPIILIKILALRNVMKFNFKDKDLPVDQTKQSRTQVFQENAEAILILACFTTGCILASMGLREMIADNKLSTLSTGLNIKVPEVINSVVKTLDKRTGLELLSVGCNLLWASQFWGLNFSKRRNQKRNPT